MECISTAYVIKRNEFIPFNNYRAIYVLVGHLPQCTVFKRLQKYGTNTTIVFFALVKKMNAFILIYWISIIINKQYNVQERIINAAKYQMVLPLWSICFHLVHLEIYKPIYYCNCFVM